MTKTATLIRQLGPDQGWRKDSRVNLYRLDPPAQFKMLLWHFESAYVVASSIPHCTRTGQPETQLFWTNAQGEMEIFNMQTQALVQREHADAEALEQLGYTILPSEP